METYDIAVVGSGLSGLLVAANLPSGASSILLEAHATRLGGRLRNTSLESTGIVADLGAAWVWPQQYRLLRVLRELGVQTFPQPDDPGSIRMVGGAFALIRALAERYGKQGTIRMGWEVVACHDGPGGNCVVLISASGETVQAKRVVLAVPPRLLFERVSFRPALSTGRWREMERSLTWMAGVTKVVLVFPERFWILGPSTNTGLCSGPSRPAFQVYDGGRSKEESAPAALTFFTLAPSRQEVGDDELAKQCASQLAEVWGRGMGLYGDDAIARLKTAYTHHVVQRWAEERFVSDDPSPSRINPHPEPVEALGNAEWGGRLLFASAEADQNSPGVMEGAVGAAECVLDELRAPRAKK